MIEHLALTNVGPAPELALDLAPRLNLFTGDNGLGKSFLLDIVWWALTRRWPAEVNPQITSGLMARPRAPGEASISFSFTGKSRRETYRSTFDRMAQAWTGRPGRPANPGLVLYAHADGGFSVWDPARNYWKQRDDADVQERPPAYVFSANEVWNGLKRKDVVECTGLLFDWILWQSLGGDPFEQLVKVLDTLSPPGGPKLTPGPFVRLGLSAHDTPTLKMPYGVDVPLPHASAGMKRVLALSYLLVWAWQEHVLASREIEQPTTHQVIFLVDEVEAHLHPRWQRQILKSLLSVMEAMVSKAAVQLIVATHSPLILASAEPFFDPHQDAWLDFDFDEERSAVELQRRPFVRRGTAGRWLTSRAFDFVSEGRSIEAEEAIAAAELILDKRREGAPLAPAEIEAADAALRATLSDMDGFWIRWSAMRDELKEAP